MVKLGRGSDLAALTVQSARGPCATNKKTQQKTAAQKSFSFSSCGPSFPIERPFFVVSVLILGVLALINASGQDTIDTPCFCQVVLEYL